MTKKIIHQLSMSTLGGVEALFHDYLTFPNKAEFEHHLLITAPHMIPEYKPVMYQHAESVSYAKYWKGLKVPKWPKAIRRLYKKGLFQCKKPDIALFWNNFVKDDWLEAAQKSKSTVVYYDHGGAFAHPNTELAEQYFKGVQAAMTCSYASKRMLELRWGYKGEIHVVKNALRSNMQDSVKTVKTLPKNRPIKIGSVGRLVPAKGFSLGLHATKILLDKGIDAEFHIAGEGRDLEWLKEVAKKLNIQDKVIFHGLLYDLSDFYQQIDVYFSGSIRDAFPLVLIEAAAYGCPIVGPRIDGVPEIIDENMGICVPQTLPIKEFPQFDGSMDTYSGDSYDPVKNCLVKPGFMSPSDMADGILKIISDSATYEKMSASCIQRAERDFKFSRYVEDLDQTITRISINT